MLTLNLNFNPNIFRTILFICLHLICNLVLFNLCESITSFDFTRDTSPIEISRPGDETQPRIQVFPCLHIIMWYICHNLMSVTCDTMCRMCLVPCTKIYYGIRPSKCDSVDHFFHSPEFPQNFFDPFSPNYLPLLVGKRFLQPGQ